MVRKGFIWQMQKNLMQSVTTSNMDRLKGKAYSVKKPLRREQTKFSQAFDFDEVRQIVREVLDNPPANNVQSL
jgi:hypothetical protein